eukprot:scaffold304842_cov33-Tisochrysis_lutea.AAC.2
MSGKSHSLTVHSMGPPIPLRDFYTADDLSSWRTTPGARWPCLRDGMTAQCGLLRVLGLCQRGTPATTSQMREPQSDAPQAY